MAYEVYPDTRPDALVNVLHAERPELAIVFCHTKEETERLADASAGGGAASPAPEPAAPPSGAPAGNSMFWQLFRTMASKAASRLTSNTS